MKVLVADDIKQNRYLLQKLLEGHGYAVETASNGVEALEKARESPPDMVITDSLMPKMDGFQLCRELKKDEELKSLPVLFYSAEYTDKKSRELALSIGAAGYIMKPIEPDEFIKIVKETFEKYERGELKPTEKPMDEKAYMKLYSERLIQKLEDKLVQLEKANEELEQEITERKRAEERIERMNSVLKAIRNVNQLIIVEKDQDSLLQKACDVLIEARGYDAAWLGFLRDGETFAMVKGSGFREDFARFREYLLGGEHPPCFKNALAQKVPFMLVDKSIQCGDCCFKNAHTDKEVAIIRIEHANRLFGLLAISVASDVAADEEEKGILREVAGDIGFALHDMEMEDTRKRLEEELAKERDYTRHLIESALDFQTTLDKDGIIMDVNEAFEKIVGKGREDLIGASIYEYLPREETEKAIAKIFEQEKVRNIELTFNIPGKETLLCNFSGSVFTTPEEELGIYVTGRDITERKQAEEALRESEELFRAIFETAQDSVFIKDHTLNYTQVNPAMEKLFGLPASKMIGLTDDDLFGEEAGAHIREVDSRVLGGDIIEEEHTKPVKGIPHTFHVIKVPMCDSSGEIIGLCGIARDITERKRAEEQIKASLREKEVLLREIHHRVKNNLQVVSSLLNMQARATKDKNTIAILSESQNRINAMTLIHTQLYESKNLSGINVKRFVDKLLRQMLQNYPVQDTKITPIIHVADYPLSISTAVPVGLIINETLSNALKHAFVNRKEGKIEVTLSASEKGKITLAVSDNGVGLPEGFDINATRTLGLRLVKILVEDQLQGNLRVISKEGTTVNIEFDTDIENNGLT